MKYPISLFILFIAITSQAASVINIGMSPIFPTKFELIDNAWNASLEWGRVFDDRITVGIKGDFMWSIDRKTSQNNGEDIDEDDPVGTVTTVDNKSKIFMFPLSVFISLSPIPQYRLHPVARFQVGYNSMTISYKNYSDKNKDAFKRVEGYYNGVSTRAGIDAVYDIGSQSSIFAGFSFHSSTVEKRNTSRPIEFNLNAPEIRMGLSIYY